MASILVTDGLERAALATCRSLVARGDEVHVSTSVRHSLAGVSRRVREHVIEEEPVAHPEGFARAIGVLARRVGARVLLPISDPAVMAILTHPEHVPPGCVVPFAPLEAFRRASDKVGLLPVAQLAGFAIPESTVVLTPEDALDVELAPFLPGVLKPHRSVVQVGRSQRRLNVVWLETVEQGRRLLSAMPREAYPVLVQRRIDGPAVGFFALRWDGQIRATFAHRRLREIPPTGGVSVYRESIAIDPVLDAAGRQLLEALGWHGVAMVECKQEATSGKYYVIEINARFWGSLQLAIDAGVDFPRLLAEHALGEPESAVQPYRVGIRSRWLWGEMDHAYLQVKLRKHGVSALRALLVAMSGMANHVPARDRCEILRLKDPLPFLVETLRRFKLLR